MAWHGEIENRLARLEALVLPVTAQETPKETALAHLTRMGQGQTTEKQNPEAISQTPPEGTETTDAETTQTERTTTTGTAASHPGPAQRLVLNRVLDRQQHRLLPTTLLLAQALDQANQEPHALWLRRPLAQMLTDLTGLDFPARRNLQGYPEQEKTSDGSLQSDYSSSWGESS